MNLRDQEELWEAINAYAAACGGDTSAKTASPDRAYAVVTVNRVVEGLIKRAVDNADDWWRK